MVKENLYVKKQQYFTAIFFLFMVLLLANMVGMIPYSFTITSSFIVTFFLSLTFFIGLNVIICNIPLWVKDAFVFVLAAEHYKCIRALSFLLLVSPSGGSNDNGPGKTWIALFFVSVAALSGFAGYALARRKYKLRLEVQSPNQSDQADNPPPALVECIRAQTPEQSKFFYQVHLNATERLRLIKQSDKLCSEQPTRFKSLINTDYDCDSNAMQLIDATRGGWLPELPATSLSTAGLTPEGRTAFYQVGILSRLTSVRHILMTNNGRLPPNNKLFCPSTAGYSNFSGDASSAHPSALPAPAVELAFGSFELSCGCRIAILILFSIPSVLQRFFPSLFISYSNGTK